MGYSITGQLKVVVSAIILTAALFSAQVTEAAGKEVAQKAHPFNDSYCLEYNGYNICYANQGVVQQVSTPSGNTVFMGSGSSSYTETDPLGKIVYQDTLRYQSQGLTMEGVLFEFGQKFKSTLLVGDAMCTATYMFHFVDEKIQIARNHTCG